MHRPLCPAAHCGIRNRHLDDCPDREACRGCLPRPAADGLRLCWVCVARIGEDAFKCAQLHRDLVHALMRGGRSEHISGTGDRSKAPDDTAMDAREAIHATLARLVRLIAGERGISLPGGWGVQRLPRGFIGPPNRVWRIDDSALAMAGYIAKHREWLAAHPAAAEHAHDLRVLAGDGRLWATAYPCGNDRLYIGDCPLHVVDLAGNESVCGTRLYQLGDAPLLQCTGCGTDETVEWWQRHIVGDAHGEVDAYAGAAWLSLRWCRPVDPALIRQWASRGKVEPVMVPELRNGVPVMLTVIEDGQRVEVPKTTAKRDERGRVIYELAVLRGYAEQIWGAPAPVRRMAA